MNAPSAVLTFDCPGRLMPDHSTNTFPGYVACYRAGHHCPPKVAVVTESETHRTTTWRCPCCGDFGGASSVPKEWS